MLKIRIFKLWVTWFKPNHAQAHIFGTPNEDQKSLVKFFYTYLNHERMLLMVNGMKTIDPCELNKRLKKVPEYKRNLKKSVQNSGQNVEITKITKILTSSKK